MLRLRQGSGLDGLAAMEPSRQAGPIRLLRPLLTVSRHRLLAVLAAQDQAFVDDPSNRNPRFERVRMRRLMRDLDLSAEKLADLAAVMGQARRSMDALVDRAERLLVSHHALGFAVADRKGLADLPPEVGVRLLSRLVRRIGGRSYPPRSDRLHRLFLLQSGTLAGCRLAPKSDDIVLLCREMRGIEPPKPVAPGQSVIWDDRFRIFAAADAPPGALVGPLGPKGWEWLKSKDCPKVPAVIRASLPAIWVDGHLWSVPHLEYISRHSACIIQDCHYFSVEALGYNHVPLARG